MRRTLGAVGMAALLGVGVIACGQSSALTNVPLGFDVAEGLLLVSSTTNTEATVVLASAAGLCPEFQKGVDFVQFGGADFLVFDLTVLGPYGGALPLTAGTYTIVIPSLIPTNTQGLYAAAYEYETDDACNYSPTGANSGTVTVQPFSSDAGATSQATFTVVFGTAQITQSNSLTTCVLPGVPEPDAGTCIVLPPS